LLSGPFLTLLRWRRRHRWLLLLATVAATYLLAPFEAPAPWWPRLAAGVFLVALLGALEPVLVAMLSAEAGALWTAPDPFGGYAVGLATAAAVSMTVLLEWRGRRPAPAAAAGTVVLLAALLLALFRDAALAGSAATALVLAALGMDILLPRDRGGAPSLKGLLGGLYVFVYALVAQVLLLCIAMPILRWPVARVRTASRRAIRGLLRSFPYGDREFLGMETRTFAEPAIVVSNHQSSLDIPLVLALPGDVRLTTSPRVWDEPWLGYAARRLEHIRVDEHVAENCRRVLDAGACVHFFPEGTRSRGGYPARFHRGAFELAVRLRKDIVPVLFTDTRSAVPRDAYWVESFRLSVKVLPRIPAQDDSRALRKLVQERIREEFAAELGRLGTPSHVRRKVARRYRYQGWRVWWAVRRELAAAPLPERPADERVRLEDCGYGVKALLLAERFPWLRIDATESDPRRLAVARHAAAGLPQVRFET